MQAPWVSDAEPNGQTFSHGLPRFPLYRVGGRLGHLRCWGRGVTQTPSSQEDRGVLRPGLLGWTEGVTPKRAMRLCPFTPGCFHSICGGKKAPSAREEKGSGGQARGPSSGRGRRATLGLSVEDRGPPGRRRPSEPETGPSYRRDLAVPNSSSPGMRSGCLGAGA